MTRSDLMYIATGRTISAASAEQDECPCVGDACHGCAECEPADEDTAPEPREVDSATLLAEAVAIIELLICREQMNAAKRREGYRFTTHTLLNLRKAQDALAQIRA